jgi:hypothetical protein
MTAVILQFPRRTTDVERLALLASNLQRAIPLPTRDVLLDRLMREGAALVEKMDEQRLDEWLDDLDAWERTVS